MIDLNKLIYLDKIDINENVVMPEDFISKDILGFEELNIEGLIFLEEENYKIKAHVKGGVYIKDSKSLNKVLYKLDFDIDDLIEENLINKQNMLDLNELLWENIVLEIPISYSVEDALSSGDNWQFKKDDANKGVDPRMQKILDYNKGGE